MSDPNETQQSTQPVTTEETPPSLVSETSSTETQPTQEQTTEEKPPVETPAIEPLTAEAIKIPEGLTIPDESRDKFIDIMNDGELSPSDRANALLALQAETMKAALEADSGTWEQTQKGWQDEVKADTEIGGEKLQPALTNISKLIDEYGSPELRGIFDLTGAGNNVYMIKFLNNISAQLTEGDLAQGNPPQGDASVAAQLYPSMKG